MLVVFHYLPTLLSSARIPDVILYVNKRKFKFPKIIVYSRVWNTKHLLMFIFPKQILTIIRLFKLKTVSITKQFKYYYCLFTFYLHTIKQCCLCFNSFYRRFYYMIKISCTLSLNNRLN